MKSQWHLRTRQQNVTDSILWKDLWSAAAKGSHIRMQPLYSYFILPSSLICFAEYTMNIVQYIFFFCSLRMLFCVQCSILDPSEVNSLNQTLMHFAHTFKSNRCARSVFSALCSPSLFSHCMLKIQTENGLTHFSLERQMLQENISRRLAPVMCVCA